MRKTFIRIMAFLLILATLMPLVAACDNDNVGSGGSGEGSGSGTGEGSGSGSGGEQGGNQGGEQGGNQGGSGGDGNGDGNGDGDGGEQEPTVFDSTYADAEIEIQHINTFEDGVIGESYPAGGATVVTDIDGNKALTFNRVQGTDRHHTVKENGPSGKSFVYSVDVKLTGTFMDCSFIRITANDPMVNGQVYSSDINALFIMASRDGGLYLGRKDGYVLMNEWTAQGQSHYGYGNAENKIGQLSVFKYTNIAIAVNVAENYYIVYIDGVAVTERLAFLDPDSRELLASSSNFASGFGATYCRVIFNGNASSDCTLLVDNAAFYYADALYGEMEKPDSEGGNGDDGMNDYTNDHINGEYLWEHSGVDTVEAELIGRKKTVIADFTSNEFVLASGTASKISSLPGAPSYVFDLEGGSARINLPAAVNIIGTYFIEFDIYSPKASGSIISFSLPGCEASFKVKIDFEGKKTVKVLLSQISVRNPRPNVTAFVMTAESGTGKVYIGNVYAVEDIYKILVPSGVDVKSEAPYGEVIDKFVEYTVGLPTDSSAEMLQKRESYTSIGKQRWDHFKSTYVDSTTPNTLFGLAVKNGSSYANGTVMYLYQYINDMANAYASYGGEYYKDPELLADILKALEYGYNCAYGKNILAEGKTWGDWYHWDVPIPKSLAQTIALLGDGIDYETTVKYLAPFRLICYFPEGLGGNKMLMSYNVLLAAALERDAYRFCLAKELIYDEFFYIDRPENPDEIRIGDGGPYTDGSYVQHGEVAYTGVYGMALVDNIAFILSITNGTVMDLDHSKISIVYEWIFNNYNSVVYEGHYMPSLMGRGIGGTTDTQTTVGLAARCITLSAYAPSEWREQMRSLAKYYMNLLTNIDFTQKVPACLIGYCVALYDDDTVIPWQPTYHARTFGAMARSFQYGPKYGVSISMSSTRISKYESINGANYVGWYHGDGMIYIHTDGYDYNNVHFCWGNPYLMPGTTVNTAKRYSRNIYPMIMNSSPYAGGVSQGKFGVTGYILGYDSDKAFASNTFVEKDDTRITARKSYFMFDNEIVCVGSGINDCSGDRVLTVVENRYWRNTDVLSIDGVQMNAPATAETAISARTMHFTNMGGYVFLNSENGYDGATVKYQKASHGVYQYYDTPPGSTDRPRENFLEITVDHGLGDGNVEAGKYFYAYLPESTVQETESYSANPDALLLANSAHVHAVLEKRLGIVAANFFENGNEQSVAVGQENYGFTDVRSIKTENTASVIISKNESGETVITVSDPTQLCSSITLEIAIEGLTSVVSCDEGVTATVRNGVLTLTAQTLGTYGAGFTAVVR